MPRKRGSFEEVKSARNNRPYLLLRCYVCFHPPAESGHSMDIIASPAMLGFVKFYPPFFRANLCELAPVLSLSFLCVRCCKCRSSPALFRVSNSSNSHAFFGFQLVPTLANPSVPKSYFFLLSATIPFLSLYRRKTDFITPDLPALFFVRTCSNSPFR
jgi:hypothetical protein